MMIRIAATIVVALLVAACDLAGPGAADVDGTWQLTAGSHRGDALPIVAAAPITLTLDGARIGGTAACNHYGGDVEIDGARIQIGMLAVTEMGCDQPVMESEAAYLAAIADVSRIERTGATLTLSGDGVELTYALVPPTPDAALIGPVWTLDSVVEGDAVSSVMGEPATLELHDDGTLTGTTGCRRFDGRYTMSDAGISITELSNTDQACPGLEQQDEHVLGVIGGGFAYEISGDRLTLSDGDAGLVYARVER